MPALQQNKHMENTKHDSEKGLFDKAAQELDFIVKLRADLFAQFLKERGMSDVVDLRNIISMRCLAVTDTKDRLLNVAQNLPSEHPDTQEYLNAVNALYGQLVLHEDKTVLCNKELERRGVDLHSAK